VKLPFEPSTLAQAAGIAALEDSEFIARSLELNARGLAFLTQAFTELELDVVPSEANFLMIVRGSEADAEFLARELLKEGIIIRPLKGFGLPHCLRITVGKDDENEILAEAMRKVLSRTFA
jgi:histidinol-phosphate aminotransferase